MIQYVHIYFQSFLYLTDQFLYTLSALSLRRHRGHVLIKGLYDFFSFFELLITESRLPVWIGNQCEEEVFGGKRGPDGMEQEEETVMKTAYISEDVPETVFHALLVVEIDI